jgi:hypothetical protein
VSKFLQLEQKIIAGVACEADFEGFDPKDVFRIKEAVPMQHRGLLCPSEIEAALALVGDGPATKAPAPAMSPEEASRAARTKSLIFNVQLGDRMGDVIISNPADAKRAGGAGWELQHWIAAGAPYLWCHDPYDGGVVGKCSNTRPEKVRATLENGEVVKAWALVSDVEFLADDRLEHAVESWAMVEAGFTASSVGFIPKVTKYIEDEEERATWGLGRWGALICSQELLECSHVLIPANPWSLEVDRANGKAIVDVARKMVGRGLLTAARADRLQQAVERRARTAVVVPDLGKMLAPKLAAAKMLSGKPCEGLECMAASGGETKSGAPALVLGGRDEPERMIPLPQGMKIPTAVLSLAGAPGSQALVISLGVDTIDPDEFGRRLSQNREAVADAVRAALATPGKSHDCGCGAKTLQQQLTDAKAAQATAEARVRELEALPEIRNVLAVRRAMDAGSEVVEHLATALEGADEILNDNVEPVETRSNVPLDLQPMLADPTLLRAVEPLMRWVAAKARSGAPRSAAASLAPKPRVASDSALVADLNAAVADCQSARVALGARSAT